MKHLTAINRKAARMEEVTKDVVALQGPPQQPEPPHIPNGCSLVFSPGWEADRNGGTAGLCQPVERDLFDCHMGCYWPAQVPELALPQPAYPLFLRAPGVLQRAGLFWSWPSGSWSVWLRLSCRPQSVPGCRNGD